MTVNGDAGSVGIKWIYGWDSKTVQYVNSASICFVCGIQIVFYNLERSQTEQIFTIPGNGIQQFCAHKIESLFAYSEVCVKPRIFIYKYPSLNLACQLTDGSEFEIKSINFSWDNHVICLSGLPDFKITIWRWTTGEKLMTIPSEKICHPNISFNPCNWRNICTMQSGLVIWWDIYQYLSDFVYVDRHVHLTKATAVKARTQQGYPGLKLPQVDIDPPDKYKIKTGFSEADLSEPTSHCWLPNGDLLVGTIEGELWKIDADKQLGSVIWNANDNSKLRSQFLEIHITAIVYHKTGLIVGTMEGLLIKLRLHPVPITVLTHFKVHNKIIRLEFSPNFETLLIACENGAIYTWHPSHEIMPYSELYPASKKVIAAEMIPPWSLYIVILLDDNTVCTMLLDSKEILSTIKMPENCICLACSSLWYGAVLGTTNGNIFVLEYSKYPNPRLIHISALDFGPISMIKFDESGHIMLVLVPNRIYILSGRPSANFCVFGFTDINCEVLEICTWEKFNDSHFLLLLREPDKEEEQSSGSLLTRIQINKNITLNQARTIISPEGNFPDEFLNRRNWVIGIASMGIIPDFQENVFYTFVGFHRHLLKFLLTDYTKPYDVNKDFLKIQLLGFYASQHQLSSVVLKSNPRNQQVVSVGNDGKLICRYLHSMDAVTQLDVDQFLLPNCTAKLYLPKTGSNILLVTTDGYLICFNWDQKDSSGKKVQVKELSEYTRENLVARLRSAYLVADRLYRSLSISQVNVNKSDDSSSEESLTGSLNETPLSPKSGNKSKTQSHFLMSIPYFQTPWIENRKDMRLKADSEASKDRLVDIQKGLKKLGYKVAKLLVDNDLLPESEQIPRQEFDLDIEMQINLREESIKKIASIRETTAQKNVMNNFKLTNIRRECWDAMKIKGATINAFFLNIQVINFPLKARTDEETTLFNNLMLKRMIEVNSEISWIKHNQAEDAKWRAREDLEFGETRELDAVLRQIHLGSETAAFGVDNPYFYSQFEMFTRDQKRTQIVIIQDLLYRVKEKFNKLFDDVVNKKKVVMDKILERNKRMEQIIEDIDLPVTLWTPKWSPEEKPDSYLTVFDWEIKSEKYYTPEQKLAMERKRQEEEELRRRRLAEDFRHRAILKMMAGVLSIRREDEIFKKDVPTPEFVVKKTPAQFNDDEKIQYIQYTQKVRELNDEREKLRKQLEAEFQRATDNVQEIAHSFDEEMKILSQQKMKSTMLIFQEELKIVTLKLALVFGEELNNQHAKLLEHLNNLKVKKAAVQTKVTETQRALQGIHDEYDTVTVEERQQEKIFKRDYADLHPNIYDMLVKLFRKRPKVQKTMFPNPCHPASAVENPYGEGPFGVEYTHNINRNFKRALKEMDDLINSPEDFTHWSQFCALRNLKIELENQVKVKASIIADMMAYLQHNQALNDAIAKEILDTNDLRLKLLQEKRAVLCNLDIQLVLKLGQVEIEENNEYLPDYGGLLLIHRNIVEERNKYIRALGGMKLQSMIEHMKLQSTIELLEWEHRSKQMTVEDLVNTAKAIQQMQVTREIRDYLQSSNSQNKHALQMIKLEENMNLMLQLHGKRLEAAENMIKHTEKIKKRIQRKNNFYDNKLQKLNDLLSRWSLIPKPAEESDQISERRFVDTVRWRNLVRQAMHQRIVLIELRKEMNILVQRSIPVLTASHSK